MFDRAMRIKHLQDENVLGTLEIAQQVDFEEIVHMIRWAKTADDLRAPLEALAYKAYGKTKARYRGNF